MAFVSGVIATRPASLAEANADTFTFMTWIEAFFSKEYFLNPRIFNAMSFGNFNHHREAIACAVGLNRIYQCQDLRPLKFR